MSPQPCSVPVAVIGLACRLPGAGDAPSFFQALLQGRDFVSSVPTDRWDANRHPDFVSHGAFLNDVAGLDAAFFSISESEAAFMCPQQRLLLELAWHTFEHAGIPPSTLEGSDTGVFVGLCGHDFSIRHWQRSESLYLGTGTSNAVAANRISFLFGLHGPSLAVDAACASSLSAVHLACRSIADGECAQALAGSANVLLLPEVTANLAEAGVISKSGRCHSFGNDADGYVRSEGAAMVLLKRLDLAERDGDRILGVILASGVNHNGRSNGLTAPNPSAQANLIRRCVDRAGVHPQAIDYVEAAATGTRIGDAIEVKAIKDALLTERPSSNPLQIGSVKSNLGHLEGTGGIVGLIKALLCIHHGQIPASLHSAQLNPLCQIDPAQLLIPQRPVAWNRKPEERIAAVSSFGFGGSNAHVLVRGMPLSSSKPAVIADASTGETWYLMPVSARSPKALQQLVTTLVDQLEHADLEHTVRLASSAALGRDHHRYRIAVPFRNVAELRTGLIAQAPVDSGQRRTVCVALDDQVNEMLTIWDWLYRHHPVFATIVDDVANQLSEHAPIRAWLRGDALPESAEQLSRTALNYCIASWFQEFVQSPLAFQVDPTGEIAAVAVLSGVAASALPTLCTCPSDFPIWQGRSKRLPIHFSHPSNQPWRHLLNAGRPDPTRTVFCQADDLAQGPSRFLTDLLAHLYLQGAKLDWSVLYLQADRQADFPLYPFQHEHFWPSLTEPQAPLMSTLPETDWSGEVIALPMLQQRRRQYRLDPATSVVADHVIDGHLILSAAAQIGLVANALLADHPNAVQVALTEVRFLAPTFLHAGSTIDAQLVVDPDGPDQGNCMFLTTDRNDRTSWREVFVCRYRAIANPSPARPLPEMPTLQSLPVGFYDSLSKSGYQYGQSYRWLTKAHMLADVGVYQLSNPAAAHPKGLPWHPGLLDSCFHAIALQAPPHQELELRLPASVELIEIQRAQAPSQTCMVQVSRVTEPGDPNDLWLYDTSGHQIVALKQIRFTAIPRAALAQLEQAQETPEPAGQDAQANPERWLLETVSRVLGRPIEPEHQNVPLPTLGFDSLKAMELQGYLRRRFRVAVGVAQLLGGLTFQALLQTLSRGQPAMLADSHTSTEAPTATIDIETFDRSQRESLVEIEL